MHERVGRPPVAGGRNGSPRAVRSRAVLLVGFAFAVMADPVSSVAYAVEAAARALNNDLGLLLATMGLVVGIIALVVLNYRQIVARYPRGGGAPAATAEAFGEGWAFLPVGALVVDFTLTIAISVAASASAAIALFPFLAPWRTLIAVGLVCLVACVTLLGHLGRLVFAGLTLAFVASAIMVLTFGLFAAPDGPGPAAGAGGGAAGGGPAGIVPVVLAFPVAMALATGVEAPSTAIAELDELDDDGRRRFGKLTLWMMLGIVGVLTMGLAAEVANLRIGLPEGETTMIAELARRSSPPAMFAVFQLVTGLLLLSAASSSFQAGPGLLKALARKGDGTEDDVGALPAVLGLTNSRHSPYWGTLLFAVLAVVLAAAAGGNEQTLVLFYAVAVFLSFLAGLASMAVFSKREGRRGYLLMNCAGVLIVAFTLVVNLLRGLPLFSVAASLVVAGIFYWMWVRAGKPQGLHAARPTGRG
ncbi:amino acid permease [Arthrobacter sp. B1I2]|uniref:amino acid permease n=1 Tax=Arthrobacter sp. B1I2 TaxID=3042263 RepID=UPI00277FFDA6|nr:amino acid permease [Arthrobacter sp. B1I2]MDQ0731061.1 amino acid transporter [Arthrobacter sp. B1I2]